MSKIKLTGHASGSGTLTLSAPNTSSDRTLTLPDATGTIAFALAGIDDQSSSNDDQLTITDSAVIINEDSDDLDFRVESNNRTNALFVDGANGNVGLSTTPSSLYSGYTSLQIGGNGVLWGQTAAGGSNNFWMGQNERAGTDGSEKAITTGVSSAIHMSGGGVQLYCSNSVSADANITKRYFQKNVRDSDTALSTRFGNWVGNGSGQGIKMSISATVGMILTECSVTSASDAVHFNNGNGLVGKIQTSGSSTSFITSSDYRLKENVDYTWDATTRLKQLKPARFNFISDATNTLRDGFLAHEVSSIVPEAIIGAKDATIAEELYVVGDYLPDGKSIGDVKVAAGPDYQGIDQAKLVPLLVKTIQELEARITVLEG